MSEAIDQYRRELLEASPLLQLTFCWTVGLWAITFLHACDIGRLKAVAR